MHRRPNERVGFKGSSLPELGIEPVAVLYLGRVVADSIDALFVVVARVELELPLTQLRLFGGLLFIVSRARSISARLRESLAFGLAFGTHVRSFNLALLARNLSFVRAVPCGLDAPMLSLRLRVRASVCAIHLVQHGSQ
jgi:hypothetical protein